MCLSRVFGSECMGGKQERKKAMLVSALDA